ncbi:MAG: ABC transporter substrate-binding protein [Candidatus Methylomirabilota bacterium]
MKRRVIGIIALLLIGLTAAPLAAEAQEPAKIPRIGLLSPFDRSSAALNIEAFRRGLRELGYTEGSNITIEYRFAEGKFDRLPDLAADLVRLNVAVIVTSSTPGIQAARNATITIPIVMAAVSDPVGSGFVASLAHPGGNVTGLSLLDTELSAKRLDLLREAVPGLARMGVLWSPADPGMTLQFNMVQDTAQPLGLQIQNVQVRDPSAFEGAFQAASIGRVGALLVFAQPFTLRHRTQIVDLAGKSRLPAMYTSRSFVDAGGLMAYGASLPELYRRAASYVDKILKGAKPAELPVEQPTKFELVINLKTAKALGLKIPQSVLVRADEVIQ